MKDDDKMILDDIIELQSIAQAGLYYGKDEFDFPYYEDPDVSEYAQAIKDNPNLRILFDASKDMSKADIDFVINTIEMLKKRG